MWVELRCSNCGTENNDSVKFCKKCGTEMRKLSDSTSTVNLGYSDGYINNPEAYTQSDNYEDETASKKKWIIICVVILSVVLIAVSVVFLFMFSALNKEDDESETEATVATTEVVTTAEATTIPETTEPTTQPETTEKTVTVPDVKGLKSGDAIKVLKEASLDYEVVLAYSNDVANDYVISQSPVAGKNVKEEETVTIYASKGSSSGKKDDSSSSSSSSSQSKKGPEFDYISTSSELSETDDVNYICENVMYKDDSCWSEGVSGTGKGEYIIFSDETLQSVSGINIVNGFAKNDETFFDYGRVLKMKFEFSNGTSITKEIDDTMDLQTISFGRTVETTYLKMTIVSACEGDMYDNTCISLIVPY